MCQAVTPNSYGFGALVMTPIATIRIDDLYTAANYLGMLPYARQSGRLSSALEMLLVPGAPNLTLFWKPIAVQWHETT